MSVHVQTGNMLDVVYEHDDYDGHKFVVGVYDRVNQNMIHLRDPIGLLEVLYKILKECGEI